MESREKIIEFMQEHIQFYMDYVPKHIQEKIKFGYTSSVDQIYCHLNLVNVEDTNYYQFYRTLRENFELNGKKIFEVCCGQIPILSYIIHKNENTVNYAIDQNAIFDSYKGVAVKKTEFNISDEYLNSEIIIGFRPCEATEEFIVNALKYKKDFCIYLCPCICKPINNHYKGRWSKKRWHNYLISLIEKDNNFNLKVIYDNSIGDDSPIIIAKYKK